MRYGRNPDLRRARVMLSRYRGGSGMNAVDEEELGKALERWLDERASIQEDHGTNEQQYGVATNRLVEMTS